uniref:Uncharacterized protein n=1 Tax=Lotharella globosa TaxID=91324 RepID=A0A7S3ZB54_9EUKA
MTSVQGAGYVSQKPVWDPLNQSLGKSLHKEEKKATPEETARRLEQEVHDLLLASTIAHNKGDYTRAVEKAKEAVKKEKLLTKHRDKESLEPVNFDLTYAVRFNRARQLEASGMYQEALDEYTQIVKNKQIPHSGRLRVNMGNIYYNQKRYPAAIKHYRMAMDQISNQSSSSREIRFRIMQNIGNAFVQMGQYPEAIENFEAVMAAYPNTQTGFNLLLCHYSHGNLEKMKKAFQALLAVQNVGGTPESEDDDDDDHDEKTPQSHLGMSMKSEKVDDLKDELMARRAQNESCVYKAARLIAPMLDPNDLAAGYKWVIAQLREPSRTDVSGDSGKPLYPRLAMELEIALGIAFLKRKDISMAIQVFKDFERKDAALVDQAATNLSFLYFLEGDLKSTEIYAEKAVRADRYNAKALVNKANFMFKNGYLEGAKELYLEAIGVEADCVEAIYNLGLVNKRLGNLKASLMAFSKLHRIVPKDPQVIYQIANLYDMMDEPQPAMKWFKILQGVVPTDPTILYRIGALHLKEGDETTAFHNYSDSYNVYPVNMDIISWLGVWYVKSNLYERAIPFFERAAEIEPDEIKWRLMVASCYRRMGALPRALRCYRQIHKQDPDNAECLRYMCTILKDMSREDEYQECSELLRKAERAAAQEDAMNQNRFMQDEVPKEPDIDGEPGLRTPNASPRQGEDEDDAMARGRRPPVPSPSPSTDMWRNTSAESQQEIKSNRSSNTPPASFGNDETPVGGGGNLVTMKKRGGVLVQVPAARKPTAKKKPLKKKKKAVKKPKQEEEDEWGDLDLGMDVLPPE